jgi:hypothetical protein
MINVVVEGESDRGIAEAVIRAAGRAVGPIRAKGGSQSRSRSIREAMAVGHRTGPLCVPRINEFATTRWSVEAAAQNSDSLRRALDRIRQLPTGQAS